jgi:hypothetical protein
MYTTRSASRILKTPTSVTFRALKGPTPLTRSFCSSNVLFTKISETIKDDHRRIESAYNKILDAKDAEEKDKWRNQFTWELACHSIGEELVVYPAFEKFLTDGKKIADNDRLDHKIVSFFFFFKKKKKEPKNTETSFLLFVLVFVRTWLLIL